jgi:glycosyltransferase involved in cell wall biosynthesis
VHVLPSLNSTESFGLVQVESMLCGTPVICSDLPGVRVAPQSTEMGTVVPIGNAQALADAIIKVTDNRPQYVKTRAEIEGHYSTHKTVREYERIYRDLVTQRQPAGNPTHLHGK